MLGLNNPGASASMEAIDKPQPRKSWSFKKKLLLALMIAIFVIALAVGLGVGLSQGGGGDDDDDNDGDSGGDTDDGLPEDGPERAATWRPKVNATWQIILKYPIDLESSDVIDPDVDIYDLDLFDNDISSIRTLQDAGKKVICYFSAGSYEDWRDDKGDWDEDDLGNNLDGWKGERWVDLSADSVHNVMKNRIKKAWRKGCDAIDPDNVDGYQNDNGLGLTSDDSIDFMQFLSDEAGKYNMSIGLKNAGDIIEDVIDFIDFSVNEQCIQFSECETFAAFIEADKPVFNIEYPADAPDVSTRIADEICSHSGNATGTEGFSTVIKKMNLDGWVEYCGGETFNTNTLGS